MNEGYIKLHRKIQDSWIWGRRDEWKIAWLWMLMQANWKSEWSDKAGRKIYLRPGEMVAARVYLINAFQKLSGKYWTDSAVRNFIKQLKKHDMIRTHNDQGLTILTICKYESYNSENTKRVQATTKTHAKYDQNNDHKNDPLNLFNNQEVTSVERPKERPQERPTKSQIATIKYKEEEIIKKDKGDIEKLDDRLKKMGAIKHRADVISIVDFFNQESKRDVAYSTHESLKYIVEHLKDGRTPHEIRGVIWYKIRQFTEMEKPQFIKLPTILRKEKFEFNWEETQEELKRYQEEQKKGSEPNREGLRPYKIYNTGETVWM